ncbi:MAG: hypothetical protein A3G34_06755 [Candidatus Lindowbacteria bacterium RIFCSPLOWO2_12_FULL_62_27]|nr:MAG: hypothetical protein A3G34_06755 [Candidatus Lindowbacteria bacterium RIFCSPLOWO2_12_FULL_62_27]OGH61267.1 MAG: hypothetical protein A3I06_13310 [Candidatus Lindowbacteria bacterium RIFCSPLOWO2_02_FULL_62_12]
MRILLDQNLSPETGTFLISLGSDVEEIRDIQPGADDDLVFAVACRRNRVLITFDRGFGLRALRAGKSHPGVVILRIRPQTIEVLHPILTAFLNRYGNKETSGRIFLIRPASVRVHRTG